MIISSAPSKPASPISSKVSSSENMKNGPVAASTGGTTGTGGTGETGGTRVKIAPRERQAGPTSEARGGCYQATRSAVARAGLDSGHALAAPGCRRGRLGCVRRRGPAPVRGQAPPLPARLGHRPLHVHGGLARPDRRGGGRVDAAVIQALLPVRGHPERAPSGSPHRP